MGSQQSTASAVADAVCYRHVVVDHAQVPLLSIPGAHADEGIAPLLDWLHQRGVGTVASCQGGPSLAGGVPGEELALHRPHEGYIQFNNLQSLGDALEFLRRLCDERGAVELLRRIEGSRVEANPWRWRVVLRTPRNAQGFDERAIVAGAVEFPHDDLLSLNALL